MKGRLLLALWLYVGSAYPAGDSTRGAQAFRQCMACHSVQAGEHQTGPSLAHVWNREAASADDFLRYSEALKRSGLAWNDATLDKWLTNPTLLVPGTTMTFAGIKERQVREDLIAYLKAVDQNKAPAAKGGAGMARARADLKNAPPAGQVRSITHCRDTYTVETADGKSEKVWEFNLRFKSDSSKLGPAPGKPVIVGAGMQGDRASVVFASPKEISEFIRAECR
jgi:cytochrome c